ncbi:hypothetical protein LEP1GSC192_0177 [Leptospira sp. B5-022]|nr:hypothetical protein LEP1GSC192_0177 [Leptospira sp. B5-022]
MPFVFVSILGVAWRSSSDPSLLQEAIKEKNTKILKNP